MRSTPVTRVNPANSLCWLWIGFQTPTSVKRNFQAATQNESESRTVVSNSLQPYDL